MRLHSTTNSSKQYRRVVGKVQWLAYTRPGISHVAKELARSLQAPTQFDNKRLKHMIRYVRGIRFLRHNLQPKIQIQDKRIPLNIDTYTDANWASCAATRKSTTGLVIHFFGAATHLWGQNASNNGTFISRVRTGTAAQESLYISNFIKEAFGTNIMTHADSSAAKSITMQEGTSRKASRIQLRRAQQAHAHSWPAGRSQQFHTSRYSSQRSLLNNSCTGHLPCLQRK